MFCCAEHRNYSLFTINYSLLFKIKIFNFDLYTGM